MCVSDNQLVSKGQLALKGQSLTLMLSMSTTSWEKPRFPKKFPSTDLIHDVTQNSSNVALKVAMPVR